MNQRQDTRQNHFSTPESESMNCVTHSEDKRYIELPLIAARSCQKRKFRNKPISVNKHKSCCYLDSLQTRVRSPPRMPEGHASYGTGTGGPPPPEVGEPMIPTASLRVKRSDGTPKALR